MLFRISPAEMRRWFLTKFRSSPCFVGLLAGIEGGLVGVAAVLLGTVLEIPGFSLSAGYWGTQFLSSLLYGLGSDAGALRVVCFFWFWYAAIPSFLLGWAIARKVHSRTP